MLFQVLFTEVDEVEVRLEGLLTDDESKTHVAMITGARDGTGPLDVIIPATLQEWARSLAVVEVRDNGRSIELRKELTRVILKPVDSRA